MVRLDAAQAVPTPPPYLTSGILYYDLTPGPDRRSKHSIALVLKVLADHIENTDWKQPKEFDFTLINTVTRLASVDWVLEDSATLLSVCKWVCQAFCFTCHLPSRPVRVDCLIKILCDLAAGTEVKFQAAASSMAVRLSSDRCFRLGLINYNHGFGLSALIVPLLRLPQDASLTTKKETLANSICRLRDAVDLLEQIANSSDDSRNLVDQIACPYVGKWLQFLYNLTTRIFSYGTGTTSKRTKAEDSHRPTKYPGSPLQHLPLTDTLNRVVHFLKRLVCSGSTKCLCSDPRNLSVVVRIALGWLLPSNTDAVKTTLPERKRPNDKGSLCPPDGEGATDLLLVAASYVDVCRTLLSPQGGYLKQLLLLGCFACTSAHVFDKQRSAAMELLRTLAYTSSDWNFAMLGPDNPETGSGDPPHITHWEQILVQRAFSLAFLDLPSEVTSAIKRRLFRPCDHDHFASMAYACRPNSTCINHLVLLARRFAASLSTPQAKWGQPVWLSFTGLLSKLTSLNVTLAWKPSHLFSSQQSCDQTLLGALLNCVLPKESITGGIQTTRLCVRIQLLIKHVFRAVNEPLSDQCAYKEWLGDRSQNDHVHPISYISLRSPRAQRQECDAYMHSSGSPPIVDCGLDCDLVQLPVQASILCGLSPFFEALFSRRWSLNVAQVGGIVSLFDQSERPDCVLWPLFAFIVILHLASGCEWKSCGLLRAFISPVTKTSDYLRTTPSDHVAELLGLADRLLLLLDANPDSRPNSVALPESTFLFRLQCCLLCSVVWTVSSFARQEKPDSSVIRNLFITCLRLSAHFSDISLFTAFMWLAFSDSRWMPPEASINAEKNLLKRPLAYCLYALLQFRPFWGRDSEPNLCSSVASSLDNLLLKLLRSPNRDSL
ncbi:hypothetical protein SprV_0301325700 [Sparganum proliferum]